MQTGVSEEKKPMRAIEIGRRMLELGHPEEACRAFTLFLLADEERDAPPEERMEAAVSLIQYGDDCSLAYETFLSLYREGFFREDILSILTEAFYQPNVRTMRSRYEKNIKLLRRYPYLFRTDFPAFEDLPLVFFPCDDDTYAPLDTRTGAFLPLYRPRFEEITRNFFHDLEKPVLAQDVYSQYELEYLRDNVRRSEDVGRENHLYLHYTDWAAFCSYLTVLHFRPLLRDSKLVFLMEEERAQYPIDFKERFGIDYSRFPLKPVGIREITRLIWHTQLSAHNGGDFFNEIFDFHPNLIAPSSLMLEQYVRLISLIREGLSLSRTPRDFQEDYGPILGSRERALELYRLKSPTEKDFLVCLFLSRKDWNLNRDRNARIAPALFFQPHFGIVRYYMRETGNGTVMLSAPELEQILASSLLRDFRYIKTFSPLRRPTTSCGGAISFVGRLAEYNVLNARNGIFTPPVSPEERTVKNWYPDWDARPDRVETVLSDKRFEHIVDNVGLWCLGRSYMKDPDERLFRDWRIVRFEDGKLNPRATFTRLAAFLDIPYTDTMTYCSEFGKKDPYAENPEYSAGFNTRSVFTDHGESIDEAARVQVEFFLQETYRHYGYNLQYYHGEPVDEAVLTRWRENFTKIRTIYQNAQRNACELYRLRVGFDPLTAEEWEEACRLCLTRADELSRNACRKLLDMGTLRLVNRSGRPLTFCPLLEPDPDLLDQPLYH